MTKFSGEIGFLETKETSPGVYTEAIVPRRYYGDIERQGRRWEKGENINDDIVVNNYISVVADDFIKENAGMMRWVSFLGSKWKIQSVEMDYPRVKLTLGGVWNGQ